MDKVFKSMTPLRDAYLIPGERHFLKEKKERGQKAKVIKFGQVWVVKHCVNSSLRGMSYNA